jgi:hypothetical protein
MAYLDDALLTTRRCHLSDMSIDRANRGWIHIQGANGVEGGLLRLHSGPLSKDTVILPLESAWIA